MRRVTRLPPREDRDPRRTATLNEHWNGNEDHDPFELTNVVADPANAALVATMAARLRELDPGWTGSAQAAPSQGAAGARLHKAASRRNRDYRVSLEDPVGA